MAARLLLCGLICLLVILSPGSPATQPVEEPVAEGIQMESAFTLSNATRSLESISDGLEGYRDLVQLVRSKSNLQDTHGIRVIHEQNIPEDAEIVIRLTGRDLRSCKSIGWEVQNIGFPNFVQTVRAYMELQEYEKMRLQMRILELEGASAKILSVSENQIRTKRADWEAYFLDKSRWVD